MSLFPKRRSKSGKKQAHPAITTERVLELLREAGCSRSVVEHSKAVSARAVKIARRIRKTGRRVDVDFVRTAGLLHDIGRGRTQGIRHGVEGARILKGHPRYARACMSHIGAGIDKKEAAKLGLPPGDYVPRTIEEKVIAHADNTVEGGKFVRIEKTIRDYEKKLGKKHPATKRLVRLSEYISRLTGD